MADTIRFDIHVNLGSFPGSQKGNLQRFISPIEMNQYFKTHNITHSLVLYNRDEYDLLEQLGKLTSTKVYGVQVIMGKTETSPTDENNLPDLDINIDGRSFTTGGYCYGIKLASNRGWWIRNGQVESGLDYSSPFVSQLLSSLPDGCIVSMHTQGTTTDSPTDTGRMVAYYSYRHRNLKFIMNHCGDYGPSMRVARPSASGDFWTQKGKAYASYLFHQPRIRECLEYCQNSFNIFGDMSCFTPGKGIVVMDSRLTQWTVGSDFPFSENMVDYTIEREKFLKNTEYIPDQEAVFFFESSIDELIEDMHRRFQKDNDAVKLRRKQIRDNKKK